MPEDLPPYVAVGNDEPEKRREIEKLLAGAQPRPVQPHWRKVAERVLDVCMILHAIFWVYVWTVEAIVHPRVFPLLPIIIQVAGTFLFAALSTWAGGIGWRR